MNVESKLDSLTMMVSELITRPLAASTPLPAFAGGWAPGLGGGVSLVSAAHPPEPPMAGPLKAAATAEASGTVEPLPEQPRIPIPSRGKLMSVAGTDFSHPHSMPDLNEGQDDCECLDFEEEDTNATIDLTPVPDSEPSCKAHDTSPKNANAGAAKGADRGRIATVTQNQRLVASGDSGAAVSTPIFELQHKLERGNHRFNNKYAEIIWRTLEDPTFSRWAALYAIFMPTLVIASVAITLAQSTESNVLGGTLAAVFEVVTETFFLFELMLRIAVSPNRIRFFKHFHNCVDLLVVLPLPIRIAAGFVYDEKEDEDSVAWFVLLCVTPVLRLVKTLRFFDTFKLLIGAFRNASEALPALLFTLAVITLSFAALIYAVEPRDNIPKFSTAIWLVIVTTTTVGYGDTLPASSAGTFVVSVLIICSVLYFAVPLGMVGSSFMDIWSARDKVLLMQATRERLREWGYTAEDVPTLFRHFDSDGNGELDLREFKRMVAHMGIRLSPDRCLQLFEIFDADQSGVVDDVEFVRLMYPAAYHDLYDKRRKSINSLRYSAQDRASLEFRRSLMISSPNHYC